MNGTWERNRKQKVFVPLNKYERPSTADCTHNFSSIITNNNEPESGLPCEPAKRCDNLKKALHQ